MNTKINIKENRTLMKWGNSHVMIIPNYLIKAGVIDPTKEYNVTLEESSTS